MVVVPDNIINGLFKISQEAKERHNNKMNGDIINWCLTFHCDDVL